MTDRPVAHCPYCNGAVPLRRDGSLSSHHWEAWDPESSGSTWTQCPGSGMSEHRRRRLTIYRNRVGGDTKSWQ